MALIKSVMIFLHIGSGAQYYNGRRHTEARGQSRAGQKGNRQYGKQSVHHIFMALVAAHCHGFSQLTALVFGQTGEFYADD
jgi:hypothetical protein